MAAAIIIGIAFVCSVGCYVLGNDIARNGDGSRYGTVVFLFWTSGLCAGAMVNAIVHFLTEAGVR